MLASAVANAVHNDEQDAEELFVLACYADEGPTLRRFRPRARGRATRIRKRTCHITVVVARLSERRLEVLQNRQQSQVAVRPPCRHVGAEPPRPRPAQPGPRRRPPRRHRRARRGRGARSCPRLPSSTCPRTRRHADVDVVDEAEVVADDVAEELEEEAAETAAADIAESDLADDADDAEPAADAPDLPEGAVEAPDDGSIPDGYEIKGNANSMKYHVPGGRYYDVTIAEVFFDTAEHAEAAGYEAPAADTEESN